MKRMLEEVLGTRKELTFEDFRKIIKDKNVSGRAISNDYELLLLVNSLFKNF